MRDIPDIYRYAAIALLVISLLFLLKALGGGPSGFVPVFEESIAVKPEKTVALKMDLYPPVPEKMPDLNDGYIFNQDRQFEEEAFTVAGAGGRGMGGSIDLNEVVYAGSLIVGNVRKALITYQEAIPARQRVANRRKRGQARKSRVQKQKAYKHKQLDPGEDFMGYKVAKVEVDRIVFERGSEKIEKFLYDGSKDRVVVQSAVRTGAPKTSAAGKAGLSAASGRRQSSPADNPRADQLSARARTLIPPGKIKSNTSKTTPPADATQRSRRSQRFKGLDPSVLGIPPTGVSPQNQTEPR